MDISKKDLLKETGISYGQLYRWKREGLIPEEWFEKRSSFTGQETYFPREAVLKRIEMIQQLKDMYSLEDLAKMLNPKRDDHLFKEEDLEEMKELDLAITSCFIDVLEKDEFNFVEIVVMMAMSRLKEDFHLNEEELCILISSLRKALSEMHSVDYILRLLQINHTFYIMVAQEKASYYIDERMNMVKEISLLDISNALRIKYRGIYAFE